jgi:hypothetical protein
MVNTTVEVEQSETVSNNQNSCYVQTEEIAFTTFQFTEKYERSSSLEFSSL